MTLTRRGRVVVAVLLWLAVGLMWWWAESLPELCPTDHGYVDCRTLEAP